MTQPPKKLQQAHASDDWNVYGCLGHVLFPPPPHVCGLMLHDDIMYIPRGQLDLEMCKNL
jgi:hypothetical protein